jgi:hypothetical protein
LFEEGGGLGPVGEPCLNLVSLSRRLRPYAFRSRGAEQGQKGASVHHLTSAVTESESVEIDRTLLSLAGAAAPFLPSDKIFSLARLPKSSKRPAPQKATLGARFK